MHRKTGVLNSLQTKLDFNIEQKLFLHTVFPHIRPAGIIILHSLQMRVLLENTTFLLHKIVRIASIIQGRVLYEEIQISAADQLSVFVHVNMYVFKLPYFLI